MTKRDHISAAELVGRLGQEPELQYTEDQTPYVRMSIATSETFTAGKGEIRDKTEWHNAVAWGDKATEIAENFHKGDSVVLSGSLRINSYDKDGLKNRVTELHVEDAQPNRDNQPSRNITRLVGEVREAPTNRTLDSGVRMTTISLATRTMAEGREGPREREDWHSVTLWGKTADAARDIKAGDTISINGTLRHRSVPGDNGHERKLSAVECQRFQVLERSLDRATAQPGKDLSSPAVDPAGGDAKRPRSRARGKSVERAI